jgi:hypothetical protein
MNLAKWQREIPDGGALPRCRRAVEKNRQDARVAKRLGIKGGEFEKNTLAALVS